MKTVRLHVCYLSRLQIRSQTQQGRDTTCESVLRGEMPRPVCPPSDSVLARLGVEMDTRTVAAAKSSVMNAYHRADAVKQLTWNVRDAVLLLR